MKGWLVQTKIADTLLKLGLVLQKDYTVLNLRCEIKDYVCVDLNECIRSSSDVCLLILFLLF